MQLKMLPDFGRHVRMTHVWRSLQGQIQILISLKSDYKLKQIHQF